VFAGFSAEALSQRILDCKPNFVLTTSGVRRGSKVIKLKEIVDDALERVLKEGFAVGNCHPPFQYTMHLPIRRNVFLQVLIYIQFQSMISSFQGIITEEWKIMGTVMHHVTGTCLTYANDSAVKREDTAWQEGRDVWWQVSLFILGIIIII
jgi:hypothetical protein